MTIEFQDTLKEVEGKQATIVTRVNKQLTLTIITGNTVSNSGDIDDFLLCNGLIPAAWTDGGEGNLGVELSFDNGTTWEEVKSIAGATAETGGILLDGDDLAIVQSAQLIRLTSVNAATSDMVFSLRCKG